MAVVFMDLLEIYSSSRMCYFSFKKKYKLCSAILFSSRTALLIDLFVPYSEFPEETLDIRARILHSLDRI